MQSSNNNSSTPVKSSAVLFKLKGHEHLVAGVTGGIASTLILHPLDLLKVRFAVPDTGRLPATATAGAATIQRPHYTGIANATAVIWKTEGIKGFYKGVTPNLWGAGSAWGLYFFFYNITKSRQQKDPTTGNLGPTKHMIAAAQAGVITQLLTNPIWVVKTRLCLQYDSPAKGSKQHYTGMMDALAKTYKYEGVRGLYRGLVPGLFGVSHGSLQFMAYEELKVAYNEHSGKPANARLTTVEYLTFAALSKLFAAVTTYPYQVLRARMQDQHAVYSNLRECIKYTWRVHGAKGFYRGLLPSLMRVVPATSITFVIFENMMISMTGGTHAPVVEAKKKEEEE